MTGLRRLSAARAAPLVLTALLGALTGLGQAPWGLWWLSLPALAGVALVVAQASSVWRGAGRAWVAGTAGFVVAMHWIVEPFFVDAVRHGWMAPFALAILTGGLALFWAGAGALAVWTARGMTGRVWAFALSMLGFEALRGHLFTGFPWALTGHVWIATPADQIAALGGALALSALALGSAAGLATAWLRWRQGRRVRAAMVLVLTVACLGGSWGWGMARLAAPAPEAPGLPLRIVQGNVPQHLKWRPGMVEQFFVRYLDLTRGEAATPPAMIVWPESTAPFFLDRPGDGLRMMTRAADGVPVLFGIDRRQRDAAGFLQYHNALAVLDGSGAVTGIYDKHHLVPFGEYVPLVGALAQSYGIGGLAQRILSGYTPGPGPALLDMGPLGRALPLICYEAVFPRNLRTAERPDWIVQITNDAWFGSSVGPYQHLAQAQLRAVEQGLPLVRAANTGVSAVIDARGRIVASLGMLETGVVDALLPGARAATPYARTGDAPWHVALAVALLLLVSRRGRDRH